MGTSMGQVIDYLVSGTNPNTSTTLLDDLRAVDPTVVLSDNVPVSESQSLVVIGRDAPDSGQAEEVATAYRVLGAGRLTEEYSLHGYIECYRSGPAQKDARDAALGLYDALVHWIHADLTFNQILKQGRIGQISNPRLLQTQDDKDAAGGDLRLAVIPFTFTIANHYIP